MNLESSISSESNQIKPIFSVHQYTKHKNDCSMDISKLSVTIPRSPGPTSVCVCVCVRACVRACERACGWVWGCLGVDVGVGVGVWMGG